ncbi:FAD-binding oxidoreductase [Nocardia sp. NBC_00881]|uniref:FAD-binding oxidoreductase n=1 Tax=Nocardia sp. NBC_00881 TaxID=2975995 RepID=UPI003866B21E|nr:FAD-binding oxidoreductase [Nocardia sp. NBC_00881]
MSRPSAHSYRPTSHERWNHETLATLAFDWERIGAPGIAPKRPFKVYLPTTTEEVVRAVREAKELDQKLIVRGHGHSSNNLVTGARACVLLTEWMDQIVEIDEERLTCTMQGGAVLAQVDTALAEHGLGLSIIGDHDDITAAGFASVGGISPASHRYGMFVDTVIELEYVDWEGIVHTCSRTHRREDLLRLLAGTGRHGVITSLEVSIVRVDKRREVLRNDSFVTLDVSNFIERSGKLIEDPGDAVMERGVWADLPVTGGVNIRVGQFSSYHETTQNPLKSLYNRAAYGYQQLLGYWAGRLPGRIDVAAKYLGFAAIMLPPSFADFKNVERFTDQILDSTVGDPTRMLIVLAPADKYGVLFRELYRLCLDERDNSGAITFISLYVKAIRSSYLSRGEEDRRHCELMLYVGVDPDRMTEKILNGLVERIDALTVAHSAFRYMHTRTTADPVRRQLVDPNTAYEAVELATSDTVNPR